ncbi:MAG: hypothetical protein NZ555_08265 [Geminicoccaceae bacterium]|nr:hypothetical protein [Geminicoccaceae bacterium]MCX8101338.1 hypothetical protein [Geminicoccaceae bacterium]
MLPLASRLVPGAALLALAGCLGEPGGAGPGASPVQRRVEPVPLRPEDLPAATRGALAAAILAMRGAPESAHPGIRFAPGTEARLQEPFDYRGFSAASITLLHHDLAADGAPGLDLSATIGFVDLLDRRAVTGVMLTFGPERDGIAIRKAAAVRVPARVPRFELYLVPRGRLPGRWPATHAELWTLAAREALPASERRRYLDGRQDLVLVAVGKDRTVPGAPFQLGLAETNGRPVTTGSRALDFDGFPVLVLPARIRAAEPGRHWAVIVQRAEPRGWLGGAAGETVARFDLLDPRGSGARVIPDTPPARRARV